MKNIFLLMALSILVVFSVSCSPEKRLARLLKKHPELIKTDTVWQTVTLPPDTLIFTQMVYLQLDTGRLRAITDSIYALIDSSTLNLPTGQKEVVYSYLKKVVPGAIRFPSDTFQIDDGDLSVKAWFEGNTLQGRFIRKTTSIEVPVQVNSVKAKRAISWWWLIVAGFFGLYMGRYYYPDCRRY